MAHNVDYSSRSAWRESVAEVCRRTYSHLKDHQRHEAQAGMFKTYLVETHEDNEGLDDSRLKVLIERAIGRAFRGKVLKLHRREDRFFHVEVGAVSLVFECEVPRYWAIQTVAASNVSDALVGRLLSKERGIDRLWLPTKLQLALADGKELRRLSAGFARRATVFPFERLESNESELRDEESSGRLIAISGSQAMQIFAYLAKSDDFASSIFRLDVRAVDEEEPTTAPEGEPRQVALSSVWHDGKVTLRGTWREGLESVQRDLLAAYASGIRAIEESRIRTHDRKMLGVPIRLELRRELSRDELATALFSPKGVFKLVRVWSEDFGNNSARWDVTDAHTGDAFALTYRGDDAHLEVVLPANACGNVVPRLLTNIQQQLEPQASCDAFELPAVSSVA